MAHKIKVNKRFQVKVAKTYEYIANEWGYRVADGFYEKMILRLNIIQRQPPFGRPSKKNPEIRKTLLGKYNIIYYRIRKDTIVVLNLLSLKRNPKRNPYD
jgi:plasmid stabilization system protein ParE